MLKKNFITAFSLVAFVVYVIVLMTCLKPIATEIHSELFENNIWQNIKLPYIHILFSILFFLIALRIYLHAWGTDETYLIYRLDHHFIGISKYNKFLEFPIRLAWLFMAAYLPVVFEDLKCTLIINCSWVYFLMFIFILICIWDILIYFPLKRLYRIENRDSKEVRIFLLYFDISITILFTLNIFINKDWGGDFNNWKPFIYLGTWSLVAILSCLQIGVWGKSILKSKIEFNYIYS